MTLLLAFLLTVGAAAPAASTPSPSAPMTASSNARPAADSVYTIASTQYTYEWVSDIQAWHQRNLSLETFFPFGVFVFDLAQQQRFGRNEISGEVHYWAELWGASYGHIHTSLAPNALTMPRFTVGGELYEVHRGWEFSGWLEWRRYPETTVHVLGPQIGRYLENWYLRLRTSLIERDGTWVVMQIGAARYHLGSSDSFLEGQVGYGRNIELVEAAPNGALEVSRSYFGTARVRHFFAQHFGATVSVTYSNDAYQRTSLSGGLLARW